MAEDEKFTEEISKMIADGRLVLLAVIFYRAEDESLQFFHRGTVTKEEAVAMLRKYKVIPPEDPDTSLL